MVILITKIERMIYHEKSSASILQMLTSLKEQGYTLSFRREATCLFCFELEEPIMPDDFTVDESYFFEDTANPDADRVLYAISLPGKKRGFLIEACNVYSDNISYELEQKLQWQYP